MALVDNFVEIIFHFDGNNNDIDDVAAMPLAAALSSAAGIKDKITFFYGNNLSEPSDADKVVAIRKAATFVEKTGIDAYTYLDNIQETTDRVVALLDSGKKVLSIEGGPMEAIYRAIAQTKPANRGNLTLLSHSVWNENRDVGTRPGGGKPRTWADLRADFPEVKQIDITDQNGRLPTQGFRSPNWDWLDSTSNPLLQEAREVMNSAKQKADDPSDAGMLFYAITGKETGTPGDAKIYFTQNPPSFSSNPTPAQPPKPAPDITPDLEPIPEVNTESKPGQPLIQLALMNAETNEIVKVFSETDGNQTLDIKGLDVEQFSLIAQINSKHPDASMVESVRFESDLGSRVENVAPYAIFGDKSGSLSGKALQAGEFTVSATAYTQNKAGGKAIAQTTTDYTIVDSTVKPTARVATVSEPMVENSLNPVSSVSALNLSAIEAYGGQKHNPSLTTTLSNDKTALRMEGNGWRILGVDATITPQSMLSFEFRSEQPGDINTIGFDDNTKLEESDRKNSFQLAGSEAWGNSVEPDYVTDSGWQHYDIPVGDYLTGDMAYLTFGNDQDVAEPTALSEFRNIVLHGMSESVDSKATPPLADLSSADMLSSAVASPFGRVQKCPM